MPADASVEAQELRPDISLAFLMVLRFFNATASHPIQSSDEIFEIRAMEKPDRPIETAPDPMCVAIMSTAPDILLAKRIAHVLVEEKLAACVQLTPPSLSIYEWNGELQGDEEIGMLIKTSRAMARTAIERLLEMHPYDVPEAIVVPIVGGHLDYLNWVCQQTRHDC